MTTRYTVEILRSGQPRPYADTEREYRIVIEHQPAYGISAGKWVPWMQGGDIEETVRSDELKRPSSIWDGERKRQRDWAKSVVRAICQHFREAGDDDGRTGMDAHFYPTLKSLVIDPKAGTIRAFIIEPFTD